MKKLSLVLILSVLFSANIFAGNNNSNYNNKLTFDTYVFLKMHENKSIANLKSKSQNYFLQSKNGIEYTKLYVKVNENYSKTAVENLGCKELVKTKSVALLSVPINKIEELAEFDFIEIIEIARQPEPLLDKALPSSNVDKVHQGENLELSYFGEGVIVGVVDFGFDFTHPMFSDENGNSRVKRAWVTDDGSGNSPANSDVGTLYTDSYIIKNTIKYSSPDSYHGTHVLGIAAGTEVAGQLNTYSGVASKSDIAVVDISGYGATIIESLIYLFAYADSVGKPIVVNMSLRTVGFPYDGTAYQDIMVNEIIDEYGKGHILVVGAGNEGASNMHFEYNFNTDSVTAGIAFYYYESFQILGDYDDIFSVDVKFKSAETKEVYDLISFSNEIENDGYKVVDINNNLYDVSYYATPNAVGNGKPAISLGISLIAGSIPDIPDTIIVTTKSEDAKIHFWNARLERVYSMSNNCKPNSFYTVGSPGTAENVITAGAYVTKDTVVSFTNVVTPSYGPNDNIAVFSSKGPLTNGKIKPDITAPGSALYSAMNSFNVLSAGTKNIYITDKTPDNLHEFIAASGTSMSTPMIAGIVALMLELNPKLTQAEIKDIMRITAINDDWTGDAKENKSPIWGWGKINAYAIMKHLETGSISEQQDFVFNIFPNPITDGRVNIQLENTSEMPYIINVFDESGRLVYLSSMDSEKQIDLSKLSIGVYFIELYNHRAKSVQKVVKM